MIAVFSIIGYQSSIAVDGSPLSDEARRYSAMVRNSSNTPTEKYCKN